MALQTVTYDSYVVYCRYNPLETCVNQLNYCYGIAMHFPCAIYAHKPGWSDIGIFQVHKFIAC